MNRHYIFATVSLLFVVIAFQNCSGAKFTTGHSSSVNMSIDSANRAPANIQESTSQNDQSNPDSSQPSTIAPTPVQPPVMEPPVTQPPCECEFDLNSYYNQGYTTTFYVSPEGKAYYPNSQTGKMRLPGVMNNQFHMTKGNSMVVFVCKKGLLSTSYYNFDAGTSAASRTQLAIAPDCPNIECKFKLQNGYTTTFVTSRSGKTYSPDASGNMSLPGDFNPYQLNTYNAAGSMIYYRCEKGILTMMDNNLSVMSVEPAY